jgi:hypothetical protein
MGGEEGESIKGLKGDAVEIQRVLKNILEKLRSLFR